MRRWCHVRGSCFRNDREPRASPSPRRVRRARRAALLVAALEAGRALGGALTGLEESVPGLAGALVGQGPGHEVAVGVRRARVLIALAAHPDRTLAGLRVGDGRSFAEALAVRPGNTIVDADRVLAMGAFGHVASPTGRVRPPAEEAFSATPGAAGFAEPALRVGHADVLVARRAVGARLVGGAALSCSSEPLARALVLTTRVVAGGIAIELFVAFVRATFGHARASNSDPSAGGGAHPARARSRAAAGGPRSAAGLSHVERHQARPARLRLVSVHAAAPARTLRIGRARAPVTPRARLGAGGVGERALVQQAGASGGEHDEGGKQEDEARCAKGERRRHAGPVAARVPSEST